MSLIARQHRKRIRTCRRLASDGWHVWPVPLRDMRTGWALRVSAEVSEPYPSGRTARTV
jgi:hypothetical protein